jgi:hypothetical protein
MKLLLAVTVAPTIDTGRLPDDPDMQTLCLRRLAVDSEEAASWSKSPGTLSTLLSNDLRLPESTTLANRSIRKSSSGIKLIVRVV